MSDFFNSGWSIYIAVATIVGLVACLALLIIAARRSRPATWRRTRAWAAPQAR
jgi:cytochrome c oxidase cbb3-type subunit 3